MSNLLYIYSYFSSSFALLVSFSTKTGHKHCNTAISSFSLRRAFVTFLFSQVRQRPSLQPVRFPSSQPYCQAYGLQWFYRPGRLENGLLYAAPWLTRNSNALASNLSDWWWLQLFCDGSAGHRPSSWVVEETFFFTLSSCSRIQQFFSLWWSSIICCLVHHSLLVSQRQNYTVLISFFFQCV